MTTHTPLPPTTNPFHFRDASHADAAEHPSPAPQQKRARRRSRRAATGLVGLLLLGAVTAETGAAGINNPLHFSDVQPSAYYANAVTWAAANGITDGVGDTGRFEPSRSVTRAELVTMLWRQASRPTAPLSLFNDVPADHFSVRAASWAVDEGITSSNPGSAQFRPNQAATRAEVATMLWRAAGRPSSDASPFFDVGRSHYAADAVTWARAAGITNGVGTTGRFEPDRAVTRGEVVTFLWRAQQDLVRQSPQPKAPAPTSPTPPATTPTTAPPTPPTTTPPTTTPPTTAPPAPAPAPAPAPSDFPTASTTGVPAGVTLRPSGSLTITSDGTVIDGLHITGSVTVDADNVVIRNSKINGTSWYPVRNHGRNLLIEDTEIFGSTDKCQAGVSFDNYTVRRVNIHSCEDGLKMDGGNVTVEDSYIHDLSYYPGDHNDLLHTGKGSNLTIRGNRLVHGPSQTSVLIMKTSGGPISNVLLENNYLEGGNYVIYSRDGGHGAPTNVTVRNNVFGRNHVYGLRSIDGSVNWHGNVWADTGTAAE